MSEFNVGDRVRVKDGTPTGTWEVFVNICRTKTVGEVIEDEDEDGDYPVDFGVAAIAIPASELELVESVSSDPRDAEITRLRAQVDALTQERDAAVAKVEEPELLRANYENGLTEILVRHPVAVDIAKLLTRFYIDSGAPNFLELTVHSDEFYDDLLLTIRRKAKPSPADVNEKLRRVINALLSGDPSSEALARETLRELGYSLPASAPGVTESADER